MWAVLVVVSLLFGVLVIAASRRGNARPPEPEPTGPQACAAPQVRATARTVLRAEETGRAVQPVRVRVTEEAIGDEGVAQVTVTARGRVVGRATASGDSPLRVTARAARRACASGATVREAERRAEREARRAGLRAARAAARRRLRAITPRAEGRLRARLRARALGLATRKALEGVPAEQERLRAKASAEALRRARQRAAGSESA
jgi:hypothetical protein